MKLNTATVADERSISGEISLVTSPLVPWVMLAFLFPAPAAAGYEPPTPVATDQVPLPSVVQPVGMEPPSKPSFKKDCACVNHGTHISTARSRIRNILFIVLGFWLNLNIVNNHRSSFSAPSADGNRGSGARRRQMAVYQSAEPTLALRLTSANIHIIFDFAKFLTLFL